MISSNGSFKILRVKFVIALYSLIVSMNYNQYEHYSVKGGRRAEQVEAYRNPSITVKELRVITDTLNEYKEMSNFTREVLHHYLVRLLKFFYQRFVP